MNNLEMILKVKQFNKAQMNMAKSLRKANAPVTAINQAESKGRNAALALENAIMFARMAKENESAQQYAAEWESKLNEIMGNAA